MPREGHLDKGPSPKGCSRYEVSAMHESVTGELQVPCFRARLWRSAKYSARKGWVRPVPAAAVIPAPQVVTAIIGPKESVAGLKSSL